MPTLKSEQQTRTALTTTAMNSLAVDTYVVLGTITLATNDPMDCLLEIAATPGTVSGDKQLNIFAQKSLDGVNFETGPSTGTSATDEPVLSPIGNLPLLTNATLQRKIFSLAAALGGALPYAVKIIARNRSGAALAASGNSAYYSEVFAPIV